MRCENCKYWGINKEFEKDLTAAASPTGQYPWICPKCRGASLCHQGWAKIAL